jgi:hypothetical protein
MEDVQLAVALDRRLHHALDLGGFGHIGHTHEAVAPFLLNGALQGSDTGFRAVDQNHLCPFTGKEDGHGTAVSDAWALWSSPRHDRDLAR